MPSNKTVETSNSVENFINALDNERKRKDSRDMIALMKEITGSEPKMWGTSLIGFGNYHYKYASGREGDFFITGFSPRKTPLLYCPIAEKQKGESMAVPISRDA